MFKIEFLSLCALILFIDLSLSYFLCPLPLISLLFLTCSHPLPSSLHDDGSVCQELFISMNHIMQYTSHKLCYLPTYPSSTPPQHLPIQSSVPLLHFPPIFTSVNGQDKIRLSPWRIYPIGENEKYTQPVPLMTACLS